MQVLPWAGISILALSFAKGADRLNLHTFAKYIFGHIRLLAAEDWVICILCGVLLILSAGCRENLGSLLRGNLNI